MIVRIRWVNDRENLPDISFPAVIPFDIAQEEAKKEKVFHERDNEGDFGNEREISFLKLAQRTYEATG